jgi:two-component system, LytTR family, response regulator
MKKSNAKYKVVIVEDEMAAREILQVYVQKYCPRLEIIGEAKDYREAIKMIPELKPDIVFLDVELPFGNGFDVLEACKELAFETIFITAFSDYAIKALNMSAAYYLLKPLSIDELITAVEKIESILDSKDKSSTNKILRENYIQKSEDKKQLILPTVDGFEVLRIDNVLRLQANGNFTDIYTRDKQKKMVCRFLKFFEDLLPPDFIRVHRSHIINKNAVTSFHKGGGGYVVMEDGSEVEISSTYKEGFLGRF